MRPRNGQLAGVRQAAAAAALSVALLVAPGAPAAEAGKAPASTPAQLPDWSGAWRARGSVALISQETGRMHVRGTINDAPLKPEYLKQYQVDTERARGGGDPNAADVLTDTNTLNCFAGFPRYIAAPFPYAFFNQRGKTWIIIDKAVRQIFTDGRDWPNQDMRWPLMLGRSRGHWEGDTLVAETITMRPDMWLDTTPLMLSDEASVEERIRRIDDKTIENRVTIRDPVKFTHDWKFTRYYVRLGEGPEEWPDDPELCGGTDDRNKIVDGKVTVQLPQ